jgi:hypothetical protein
VTRVTGNHPSRLISAQATSREIFIDQHPDEPLTHAEARQHTNDASWLNPDAERVDRLTPAGGGGRLWAGLA